MNRQAVGPGLLMGIPTLGRPVTIDWALAFKGLNPPINFNVEFQFVKHMEIGLARTEIAKAAIEKNAKYLFFLGDDVEVPPFTLRQLIYRMEQDPTIGVVGGVYCAKADPAFPLVFRGNGEGSYWDWKIGEFFEITGIGMDATLIRVDALKQMDLPYFQTVENDAFLDGKNKAEAWTEDLYFCQKLLDQTKYKIFCDASVICKHWDVHAYRAYTLPKGSLPFRRLLSGEKRCLVIGPSMEIADNDFTIVYASDKDGADYRLQPGSLPFANDEFDWVIVNNADENFHTHFWEWWRVVKPGGRLSIGFPSKFISLTEVKKWIPAETEISGSFVNMRKDGESDSSSNGKLHDDGNVADS